MHGILPFCKNRPLIFGPRLGEGPGPCPSAVGIQPTNAWVQIHAAWRYTQYITKSSLSITLSGRPDPKREHIHWRPSELHRTAVHGLLKDAASMKASIMRCMPAAPAPVRCTQGFSRSSTSSQGVAPARLGLARAVLPAPAARQRSVRAASRIDDSEASEDEVKLDSEP